MRKTTIADDFSTQQKKNETKRFAMSHDGIPLNLALYHPIALEIIQCNNNTNRIYTLATKSETIQK